MSDRQKEKTLRHHTRSAITPEAVCLALDVIYFLRASVSTYVCRKHTCIANDLYFYKEDCVGVTISGEVYSLDSSWLITCNYVQGQGYIYSADIKLLL